MKCNSHITVYCCSCGKLVTKLYCTVADSTMETGNCYCSNSCRWLGYSVNRQGKAPKVCSKPVSEETRRKMSLVRRGRLSPCKGRQDVTLYCCYCGELVTRRIGDFKAAKKTGYAFCSNRCRLSAPFTHAHKKGISEARKGWVFPESAKEKLRQLAYSRKYPNRDTSIEVTMQKVLSEKGIHFETHKKIYGLPDIFIKPNIAIFCDGTYFHGDPRFYKADSILKKGLTAKQIWDKDAQVTVTLQLMGYVVLRFWEKEIKDNPDFCMSKIVESIKLPLHYSTNGGKIKR